jgi:hypothetical protein
MRVGVAGRGTLDGASQSGKPGIQTDSGKSTLVYMHEYPGHPDDYFTKFRRRRRPSVLASPRAPDMWSNLPNVTRDACGVFVQTFPKELIVRRSAYLSVFHHHLRRVARARSLYFFFPSLAVLVFPSSFSYMPDITPSTPAAAQPSTPSSSSINAQFLNAVTRGDEHYTRSLLARGADVNAMDATGRSAVACVLAGERCATVRVFPPQLSCNKMMAG